MADRWSKRKEAIVLAIDIGKSSRQRDSDGKTYFEKSIYCASMVLKKKILTQNKDHLALILFGSSHTNNHLSTSQGGCYGSIETVAGLGKATWDLFNCVNSLSPTNITPSDWISTFVLAADFLKNETENKAYTGLQIIMFSNLATDISFDNIDIIATCLKMEHIRLSILGKDCEDISLNPGSGLFLRTTEATAVNFDLVLPKISYYKQKEVITKSWNAPLSFGEVFGIKVCGYEKIDITNKSSNWLFSKNYDTQDLAAAKKKHSDDNGEKMEVDNDFPMNDFYSRDEILPIIDLDTDECTYIVSGRRCLQVLGFVKAKNAQTSFLINGGSYIFKPYKTDIIAFNAVFDSMVERKEVMLVRKVDLHINLLNINVLIPQKIEDEKFFVYVSLPYHKKNHTYSLPSLDSIKSHLKEKIDPKHTDAMDIDMDDGNKFVMPENKYDFELQSLYDYIVQKILKKIIPKKIQCSKKTLKSRKSIREYDGPRLKDFLKSISFKQEFFENFPSAHNTIQLNHDEELDFSNKLIKTPKSVIKKTKPRSNEFKKTYSLKQEVSENCSADNDNTIQFGYDEELDGSKKLIKPPKSFIKKTKPRSNELKKTFSIKQEVFENCSAENDNTIQFGYDEELDGSKKLIKPPKSFIKKTKPRSNEFKKTFSIKQEVFENYSAEDDNTIQFGYDEELDGSKKLIKPPKGFIKKTKPRSNEFKKTFSIKQEVFENYSAEDYNTIQFGYDEELDGSKKLIKPPKGFIKKTKPRSNELKNTFSIKQEVFENYSADNDNTIQFGYDEELDGSKKLIKPPKGFIKKTKPRSNELKKTFSIKQEVFENYSADNDNTIQFGYDEELDGSKKLIKPPKGFIKKTKPRSNELKKTFSIKQEVFENCSAEDDNTIQFGYDEELDGSKKLIKPPKGFIKKTKPRSNELKKTFSIKQEVFENCSAEDDNTIQFGYDEELDGSNELINPPETSIENAKPLSNDFKKTFSIKQEVFENCQYEDNNPIHFGYDEELEGSNELINHPKTPIENAEPLLNEFKKTFSLKQDVLENCPAEENYATQFGHDEKLDISNDLLNLPKSFIENAEPPLNEFVKTFSLKQKVLENSSVKDNNATKVDRDEELDVSKQCVITPLNPIEDFNKLLKNGFDSAIVCKKMQYITLNLIEFSTSLEDLMKPVDTLKALREYYIINNDAKSYNNFMHLAKDAVLITGKEDMWSKFINSGIELITNAEIEASDISQESSEEFKKLSGDVDINFIIDNDSQLKEFS